MTSMSTTLARVRDGQALLRMAADRIARGSRLAAVEAGLAARELAVLKCGAGRLASGLFSEFASVLGLLDHYDSRRHLYAGLRVEFDDGLYLDPQVGSNWWNYYFEPVAIGSGDGRARIVSQAYHDLCANRVERNMSRQRGAVLVDRYITPSRAVANIVDNYVRQHWRDGRVIGVHYRGTDKEIDARRVPYEEAEQAVREQLEKMPYPMRIYVATDEQAFVDYMRARFPGVTLARDMFRSQDGQPIDVINADSNYQKGLDAVVDCLLLSRSQSLVRTASNLSLIATFLNPDLPTTLLNPER
jgi:hypothetical protein